MQSIPSDVIVEWLREATAEAAVNRRQLRRFPFFRRVTIAPGGSHNEPFSAFSKDISPSGIGLVHKVLMPTGPVTLQIPTTGSQEVEVDTDIAWCEPCGDPWFRSGGRFVGLSAGQVTNLLLSSVLAQVNRRLKERYPFFRPVMVTTGGVKKTRSPAFSRDISGLGIGLLHDFPLDPQTIILTVPRSAHPPYDIAADLQWCEPCGDGWYLSGGSFRPLMVEELPNRLL